MNVCLTWVFSISSSPWYDQLRWMFLWEIRWIMRPKDDKNEWGPKVTCLSMGEIMGSYLFIAQAYCFSCRVKLDCNDYAYVMMISLMCTSYDYCLPYYSLCIIMMSLRLMTCVTIFKMMI